MVDQVCSPTLDRNHETREYLLDKDCSAVVFGPPISARSMKMPLSAGVNSMRINGIIAAAWARRSDFTDNRPSLGAVRNRTAHCAIGDRLENWKRLGDQSRDSQHNHEHQGYTHSFGHAGNWNSLHLNSFR
jgi:hypothetical protein